jgi:hypothetical protein
MKILAPLSENSMVLSFLRAELASNCFGEKVRRGIEKYGLTDDIIINPHTNNKKENGLRKMILNGYRGYTDRTALFKGFPDKVEWSWAIVQKEELFSIKYLNDPGWVELSSGTRLPLDAAKNILENKKEFNPKILEAVEWLKRKRQFPNMTICVTADWCNLVLLEGHLRLTAMAINSDRLPDKIEIMVGFSPDMKQWVYY